MPGREATPPSRSLAHLPLACYYIAGGIGDTCAALVSHPFDTVKVRQQVSGELDIRSRRAPQGLGALVQTFRAIVVADGVFGLYQGLSASVLRQSVFSTLRHGGYATCAVALAGYHLEAPARDTAKLPPHPSLALNAWQAVGCGVLAGSLAAFIANPFDIAPIRMQADGHWPPQQRRNYRSGLHAVGTIASAEGAARLWRGCGPTVSRATLITATQLPTYHAAKASLLRAAPGCWKGGDDPKLHLSASLASAACATLATCPVDVIKTRIMNMQRADAGGAQYSSALDCAVRTARTEGVLGLYKGLLPTFARLAPHTVVLWQVQELVLRTLWASVLRHHDAAAA
uniref:Mitochondrial carrier protein n=1 Tax=Pfiesteria piscicida TaxID=71001 RepID=A3E3E3_PFIPI|nr:mitochondrial carrier protein [Pfiesteria piscicida]